MNTFVSSLLQIAIISLVIFILTFFIMFSWQRHFIYFPSKETPSLTAYHAVDFDEVWISTKVFINQYLFIFAIILVTLYGEGI